MDDAADPERGKWAIVFGNWVQQDRFQHVESQPGRGCNSGRQWLVPWSGSSGWRQQSSFVPWPGRRWEFDCGRTLLLAEWWSDVEPRNPHGRRRSRIGHGGDLQPEPGSDGTFYAFIRRHGLYSSTDGQNFTPLTTQPTAGLASANCPASSNAATCLIYRGEFAVVPGRNEMYVWVVDVQPDSYGNPTPSR